jgi:hypothetical protein
LKNSNFLEIFEYITDKRLQVLNIRIPIFSWILNLRMYIRLLFWSNCSTLIPRLGTRWLKNDLDHVNHQSIGNCISMNKICTFRGQKDEKRLLEPKNGIWDPKSICPCDTSSVWEFYMQQEKTILLKVKEAFKRSLQSPKTEFLKKKFCARLDNTCKS